MRSCLQQVEQIVIASDSEAIQTEPPMCSPSLDCFALLAMTDGARVFEVLFDDHREGEAVSPSAKPSPAPRRMIVIFVPSTIDLRSS